jgi:hypothetical protein
MPELELDQLVLRDCRQVIMLAMDHVRSRMQEVNLPALWKCVAQPHVQKSKQNLAKVVDKVVKVLRGD